ncbi:putative phosphotransacetylase [Dendrosporobacter quercicolus]|uniref:Phosphate propanoyltransferase n=2 Tax=Dendrosporobacter quercicolus TaxID=146817 RepID=A0A1G9Q8D0_9FIRM|nr:putative phosphotransacetylase [Dendrosporobacter quercicolus]
MEKAMIEEIVAKVLAAISSKTLEAAEADSGIPVGVSNRHIHLSAEHAAVLFGCGHELTYDRDLKQTGEFAAKETVTLVGPKGIIRGVRVLGPIRASTQIEISRTDGFSLGIKPPVRDSGNIAGSAGVVVVGAKGAITLEEGVICAARHIHISDTDAGQLKVSDGSRVKVAVNGERGAVLHNVLVRVRPGFRREFHIDTDEANALGLSNGQLVTLAGEEKQEVADYGVRMADVGCLAAATGKPLAPAAAPPKTPAVPGKKTVLAAAAVKNAAVSGAKSLTLPPGTLVTPLARDIASEYAIELIYFTR